jgi:hypothetical protein
LKHENKLGTLKAEKLDNRRRVEKGKSFDRSGLIDLLRHARDTWIKWMVKVKMVVAWAITKKTTNLKW